MVSHRVLPNAKGSETISSVSDGTRSSLLHPQDGQREWIVISIRSPFLKIVVFLVSVAFVFLVGRKAMLELVAERLAQNPTIENLQKAIRLTPANAEYHYLLGHRLEASIEEANWKAALAEYEKAVHLNPHNAFYWLQLAHVYESVERIQDARHAIEQAARADPNQISVAWRVGNFQLRDGNVEEALRQFRVVLSSSTGMGYDSLAQEVFDLAWQGTQNNRLILDLAIPHDSRVQFDYLNFLLAKGRLDEGLEVWNRITHDPASFRANSVFPLIDSLIRTQRVDEAQQTWEQLIKLLQLHELRDDDQNLLVNGGFEGDILNGGFDWRFTPLQHVELQFDSVAFHGGTRSLSISFDGKENMAYSQFFQLVPVEPNTQYRFRGWMRSEQITTDSGPHFEISDFYAPSPAIAVEESIVGSTNWQETNLVFRTGPDTRLLRIAAVRTPSRKFDNKIQGKVWIDDLSLQLLQDVGQIRAQPQPSR